MYLNELPLEFNYDFLGVNVGTYEAKHLFYPQTTPIKIWLASTVIHACSGEHIMLELDVIMHYEPKKWLSSKHIENKPSCLLWNLELSKTLNQ